MDLFSYPSLRTHVPPAVADGVTKRRKREGDDVGWLKPWWGMVGGGVNGQ